MAEWPMAEETARLAVVGAGTMGVGIAYTAANAGYAVELVEIDPDRSREAARQLDQLWDGAVARGRTTAEQAAAARRLVTSRRGLEEVAHGAEVIVEAVPERLELKHAVLPAAEAREPRLLASNTSSISIAQLAEPLARPDRFLGLHFFNPVWAMALVEVVIGPSTSEDARSDALRVVTALGKQAVVVNDAPGFATSRLGVAVGLEAIRMVEEGVASPADIDTAMTLGYRHPVGPLELGDVVGLDVRLDIARTLQAAYGERFAPPKLLEEMVAAGRVGRKCGEGFYRWTDGVRSGGDQVLGRPGAPPGRPEPR
ncbi:MAG TPA: 3-hydroxyacyl-CoA dehydrogenase family protein [Cryptosporangiaceae bacterium]|nr:3-hydroxyacyl-CoA dehydrogenase family protein [Cryptosporangiaceae bacterium]